MKSLIWVSILIVMGIGLTSTVVTQNAFAQATTTDPSQRNTQIQSLSQSQKAVNSCTNTVGGGAFNTAACVNNQNQLGIQLASAYNGGSDSNGVADPSTANDPRDQSNFQLQFASQRQFAANSCANTVVGGLANTAACVNTQNQGLLQAASAYNGNGGNDPNNGDQRNTQLQFLRQSQFAFNHCANTVVGGAFNTAACTNNQNQLAIQLASASND
jgi:hypothetical protein